MVVENLLCFMPFSCLIESVSRFWNGQKFRRIYVYLSLLGEAFGYYSDVVR